MIHDWLDLPLGGILGVLLAVYAFAALLIFWVTFHSPLSGPIRSCGGLVAPYFTAVALLFGLLTGFLASDIADRNRQASRIVQTEAQSLTSLYTLSIASASDMSNIRDKVRRYTRSVLTDEWQLVPTGTGSPKTKALLAELMDSVADPTIAGTAGQAVHSALVNLTLQIAGARSDRLSLGGDRTYDLKWFTVLFLCFMTQIAIGAVHLEKPRAHALGLALFSVAAVVALAMIAEQESPFDGTLQVSRAPLENVLKLAPAPNNPNG
ncbi:MAG TPA: DUF4239 domain-containing protein [Pseudolabrys sp.]|nr:DUF4239 domain-containing protein [Pseudolabrys sp.]